MAQTATFYWSVLVLIAWVLGEYFERIRIPRVATYGIVGVLATLIYPVEPIANEWLVTIADCAMGLLLCELGFRFHPAWMLKNRTVFWASLFESTVTFVVVFVACYSIARIDPHRSSIVASLCIATSPAAILPICRNSQSSGPITNHLVNLTALNCLFGLAAFKVTTGIAVQDAGTSEFAFPGAVALIVISSGLIATLFAVFLKWLLLPLKLVGEVRAFAVALSIIVLTTALSSFKLSPLIASLSFGMVMRHLGVKMTGIHQDFGSLGRFMTVFLFVFMSSKLSYSSIASGFLFGGLIGVARAFAKVTSIRVAAIGLQLPEAKSWLLGLAMLPTSIFTLSLLEQSKNIGIDPLGTLDPLVAMLFLFEVIGPIGTMIAVRMAKETVEDPT